MSKIKSIIKLCILNIKQISLNPMNYLIIAFFLLAAIMLPIIFIPLTYSIGEIFIISLLPILGSIYASINFSINKSTIKSNIKLTDYSRIDFYISTIVTMFIYTVLITSVLFCAILVVNEGSLFKSGWFSYGKYTFTFEEYLLSLYTSVEMMLLVFGLSFAISGFVTNYNTYFIIILSFVLLSIIFGGTFNDYVDVKLVEGSTDEAIMYSKNTGTGILPYSMLFPSLIIFPFYAPAQHLTFAGRLLNDSAAAWKILNNEVHGNVLNILAMKGTWEFTIIRIWPFFEMFIFFIIGYTVSKFRK